MKERPILFSGPMVRAIIDDLKTQSRRILKRNAAGRVQLHGKTWHTDDPNAIKACPYGLPGDRLWVKETWLTDKKYDSLKPSEIPRSAPIEYCASDIPFHFGKKRSSLFMPRWMSRLVLEIKNIRIERLQDISPEDAQAEGATWKNFGTDQWNKLLPGWSMENPHPEHFAHCLYTATHAFGNYINKIHGGKNWNLKPSNLWDTNPLVWVISFKRVEETS